MKTFADYLPTMTAREREIVEAYVAHEDHRLCDKYGYQMQGGLKLMRSTPPAKEPVSVDGRWTIVQGLGQCFVWESPLPFKPGDRVRVVKIEEMK
jgi:hypothetical protein